MHPALARLHPYPFERLAALKAGIEPPAGLGHIGMSIGEPKHAPPAFVIERLMAGMGHLGTYPGTQGLAGLREACARWLERRYRLGAGAVDAETMVLPVNGTREALFSFAQAAIDPASGARVAMPNPCYQIYEGAALLAGAEPWYLPCGPQSGWLPDLEAVPARDWERCRLLYLCSPANPTGAVMDEAYLARALALSDKHGFVLAADECYSEIYDDESAPPPGLLQACRAAGNERYERCIVFHSLSKRSSLPGLRSGFVAGDPALIAPYLRYRTYHGSAMPVQVQLASAAAWAEDGHAAANRALYRAKFDAVLGILDGLLEVERPAGAFYLWPAVEGGDEDFARRLYATKNLTVLPGSYLGRELNGHNPGRGRLRISLVAGLEECREAATRIADFIRKA